jgi:hypothetical protein
MDKREAKIKLRKMYFAYKNTPEDSDIYHMIESEIEYLELASKGQILCSFHPSEGCDKCRFVEECDLRG